MLRLSHLLEDGVNDNFKSNYWDQEELRDKIKKHLMDYEEHSTWKEHVDSCEIGGCQYTAHAIARAFGGTDPEVVGVFGEIETDEGRNADDGGFMTHHWVEIDGIPYDFAKGTLGDYVNWHDIYDDDLGNDDWRYHPIHKKEYNIQ
jgi:hypothetical protein